MHAHDIVQSCTSCNTLHTKFQTRLQCGHVIIIHDCQIMKPLTLHVHVHARPHHNEQKIIIQKAHR